MKNKKGKKMKNIFKNILLGIFGLILGASLVKLLVPGVNLVFMNLLCISVNLLSGVVIGGSVFGIAGLIGMTTKCIDVKTEYVCSDGMEIDSELMREQLEVVKMDDKSNVGKVKPVNKYSYVYDNNYMDVDDVEIDDITNPNWRRDYGFVNIDEDIDIKVYTRKNR